MVKENPKILQSTLQSPSRILQNTFKTGTIWCLFLKNPNLLDLQEKSAVEKEYSYTVQMLTQPLGHDLSLSLFYLAI